MKKVFLILMVVFLSCSVFAGGATETKPQSKTDNAVPVAAPVEPTGSVSYKKSIKIGTTGDMPSPCPYGNSSTQTSITTNSTFNGLISIDSKGVATPELATSWQSNADCTVWTFNLRKGVKFHDGGDFTSADVKFTWEFASSTKNPGINWVITGYNFVDSIETPDAYTVIFNMKAPTPDWLFYASQKIMSKSAVEKEGIEKAGAIGTGPFAYATKETGVSWTIRRFDGYWGEKAKTEEIKFFVVTDASTRAVSLKAGDYDAIFEANSSDIVNFVSDKKYNVYKAENSANVYLGFNCGSQSKANSEIVRKAVAMSINRDDIIGACYENGVCAVPSYNVINNVTPGYVDVEAYPYDVQGAKKLLADNGIKNLTLNLTTFAKYLSVAEIIQADLSQAGITVNIRELAQAGFTSNLKSDTSAFDMYVNATSSTGGVLNIMSRFFASTANSSAMYYSDPAFDQLLADGLKSTTYEQLIASYAGMQKYLAKAVPGVALAQTYLWCIGNNKFYGVNLGSQTYDVDFTNCYVAE